MKIDNESVHRIYDLVKKVYRKDISVEEFIFVVKQGGWMNINSAKNYQYIFECLMSGNVYKVSMNEYSTEYFLASIYKDYGENFFQKAIESTKQHVSYYNSLGRGKRNCIDKIVDRLSTQYLARRADQEYILGADPAELNRLRFQHKVWSEAAYALWQRADIRAGQSVLDLGCGPGFASIELAHCVGTTGRVIARDRSARFLAFLRDERERLALPQIEIDPGAAEEVDLPPDSIDFAYSRWLLCWLADPGAALERVAHGLKSGGAILLQEYLDWGAMRLIPHSAVCARVVELCQNSLEGDGATTMDVAARLPELAARCGLRIEHFRPIARIGGVGSLEWQWLTQFLRDYAPKLAQRGALAPDELEAFLVDLQRRERDGGSFFYTPVMADAILRKQ